ncbi:YARHG domain-containing protein [Bacteroidota bacterium]
MIKQVLTLILMISFLYSCSSKTGNTETSEKNLSVEQADNNDIQEKEVAIEVEVEEPYIDDYSDQFMTVSHNRNPIKLSTTESEKVFDFFDGNKGNQIPFEIAALISENELSEEEFNNGMPLFVDEFYHSGKYALLFIRKFTGAGNNLTVLSIYENMIVAKVHGITLDADSDGSYYLSSKYKIVGVGQTNFVITEEEGFLNESGINNYVIEYLESRVYYYELSAYNNGIFQMMNYSEDKNLEYSNTETLESWNKEDLRKLRNYIFARHSYIFKSQDLSEYFRQFDWYEAKYENVDDKLSAADIKFVGLVKEIENRK